MLPEDPPGFSKQNAPSLVVGVIGQNGSDNVVPNHKRAPSALMPPRFGSWGLPDKELRLLPSRARSRSTWTRRRSSWIWSAWRRR